MTFFVVSAALAAMVVAISAAPGYVQSALPIEHSFPSQPLAIPTSHAPLTFQHSSAPLELTHTPIALPHAPITLPHAPIEISHAPIVQQAPLEIHQAPLQIAHAAPVAIAHEPEYHAPANYEFKYGVHDPHTHDVKEQAEKRVGDRVEGYYSLVEPDGTTRTVHYTADHQNGFNAVVQRSGHATHPVTAHKEVIPVIQKYVSSAPALSYEHAPALPVGHASSYADYGSSYAANYGHGFNYGGHYGSSY